MKPVESIEGIGPKYGEKLRNAGIKTVEELLKKGSTPQGRRELAQKTGLDERLILDWVNRADLERVKGIGPQYAELLQRAGVNTVVELSKRNPENLLKKLEEVNREKKLVRKLPTLKQVKDWVEQAKALPRVVTY
ncbi:DUF4332 domain-containing protein [Thermovibrio ammonificans]|uniref:Ferredoxin n=1 Tax=Thermovibrio ammonificans (strain DSM 15698 / JCM 12110 / HB-1) TaxID=648996 RepID=E8T4L0_THEA1|nr:DUF4332 domain-containing protein [Thermovibrio ammonificans]ADU97468.1 ferredoxin [Thermovibrio ammonificans HB-1]